MAGVSFHVQFSGSGEANLGIGVGGGAPLPTRHLRFTHDPPNSVCGIFPKLAIVAPSPNHQLCTCSTIPSIGKSSAKSGNINHLRGRIQKPAGGTCPNRQLLYF